MASGSARPGSATCLLNKLANVGRWELWPRMFCAPPSSCGRSGHTAHVDEDMEQSTGGRHWPRGSRQRQEGKGTGGTGPASPGRDGLEKKRQGGDGR